MERNYGIEIDALQKQLAEMQSLMQVWMQRDTVKKEQEVPMKNIRPMHNMHPDTKLSEKMDELCALTDQNGYTGLITYLGVYSSGGRQSNWIKNGINTDDLLTLIENHTAEKVLHCIGNSDRLNILLAILKKPMTVAELVTSCNLNTTGQAYHHMKPLLAADLIVEDVNNKGVYIVQPHKVQGIIMLLAGISDMVDETYTKSSWDEEE
ncbi:MAG TPA: winged helix-turn-helix domain-containing protein [Lachnospiraceae bacterium]|nr:winged helix-turn-helix domain-containing protein [Lachnospiraceae bacterium]